MMKINDAYHESVVYLYNNFKWKEFPVVRGYLSTVYCIISC